MPQKILLMCHCSGRSDEHQQSKVQLSLPRSQVINLALIYTTLPVL